MPRPPSAVCRRPPLPKALLLLPILLTTLLPSSPTRADGPEIGAPIQIAGERFNHRIPRAQGPVEVDGAVDEAAWDGALSLALPYETRPAENLPAPVDTECLVTYDDANLYIAFRAHDPDPPAIRAHLADRDSAWADDLVGFLLDTFNDERRAFEFFINPYGVQHDLLTDDVAGIEDESWDAIWQSAARLTDSGYEVEVAMPFSSLRFPPGEGEQTWGFDAIRFYPRNQRRRMNLQPIDRDRSCFVCQISKVTGLDGITPGRNLEINPTVTASRLDQRAELPDGQLAAGDPETEAGLTVSWGLSPSLQLSGTLNPDFSQVEADTAQLDINNQFALFFPERRPFFLEGLDYFSTPLDTVFTRNVADPRWGVKLVGKQGGNGLGVFAAEDAVTNLLLPGSQSSDTATLDRSTRDGVVRYRRDIGDGSSLGLLVTGREGGDYSNYVAGFDGLWRASDSDTFSVQLLGSQTRYPDSLVEEHDQPRGRFDDTALRLAYDHNSRNWYAYARYQDLGEGFRADLGFLPRVDTRVVLGGLGHNWWGGEDDRWTRIEVGADWDLTEDQSGQELERELEAWVELAGPLQSYFQLRGGTRQRYFEGVTFDERFLTLYTEASPTGSFYYYLFARVGDDIDFANVRPGDTLVLEPGVRFNLGRHLRLNLDHAYRHLDVEGGRLFTANLSQLRAVYQFNVRTFVRTILQYTDIRRDVDLHDDPDVEPSSEELFTQLLFSYKLNPRTVIFAGYSDGRQGGPEYPLTVSERTFFLKVGYAWVL